jgi:hypothetical protein
VRRPHSGRAISPLLAGEHLIGPSSEKPPQPRSVTIRKNVADLGAVSRRIRVVCQRGPVAPPPYGFGYFRPRCGSPHGRSPFLGEASHRGDSVRHLAYVGPLPMDRGKGGAVRLTGSSGNWWIANRRPPHMPIGPTPRGLVQRFHGTTPITGPPSRLEDSALSLSDTSGFMESMY